MAVTSRHSAPQSEAAAARHALGSPLHAIRLRDTSMGIDFHLISNFLALALITLAGPAVIFILFYRRGAL